MSEKLFKSIENKVYLASSGILFSTTPKNVWTILGSCVSIVFYHPGSRTGSLCHVQYPYPRIGNAPKENKQFITGTVEYSEEYNYANLAINYMLTRFRHKGTALNELVTHLYGGSNIFQFSFNKKSIGAMNVDAAKETLAGFGLKINFEDTGGSVGRKILFNTGSGRVLMQPHKGSVLTGNVFATDESDED